MSSPSIDFRALFERSPNPYMVVDRALRFVAANAAYLAVTASRLEDLLGARIADVFPHDPNDPNNASLERLRESLERVLATGEPDVLAVIAYRVPETTERGVELRERLWSATHTPILDSHGRVTHVLQHTVDVTHVSGARDRLRDLDAAATSALAQTHAGILQRASAAEEARRDATRAYDEFRRIFDHAPGVVCVLRGPEHVFELVNPAFHALVGPRDVVGKPLAKAIPEVIAQGYGALLDRVFETGEAFVGRGMAASLIQGPSGAASEIVVDLAVQPVFGLAGDVVGLFIQAHDRTAEHHIELERVRLAMIVEQASDSIGVASPDGELLFLNEAGLKLVGLPPSELAGTRASDLFTPEDLELLVHDIYPRVLKDGSWEGDFHHRHLKTGEVIPIRYNLFAVRDTETSEVRAFASVSRDRRPELALEAEMAQARATERASLAASRAQEAELAFLADAIPDQVWAADAAGALTYVNRRVTEYFGLPPDTLMQDGWPHGVHPGDLPQATASWRRAIETERPYEVELRLRRGSDQTYRWHIARALPLRDDAGGVVKWYGTNTDIDDLKRTESERDRLIQKLSASNRELDQFAYVASHDLKSPLRGISNLAQWIGDELPAGIDPTLRGYLDLIRGRIHRMNALIDGILSYSRAGRVWNRLEEVETGALVTELVGMLSLGGDVRVEVSPDMPRLVTDPVALHQAFKSLVENALKHARRPDVVVTIEVSGPHEAGEDAPPMYRFTVSDNGPGIEPAMHERLWGLFQVLQPRDEVEGSGVGLSVLKKLVEVRGGQVGLESRPGEGARFWFTWPRTDAPSHDDVELTAQALSAGG